MEPEDKIREMYPDILRQKSGIRRREKEREKRYIFMCAYYVIFNVVIAKDKELRKKNNDKINKS